MSLRAWDASLLPRALARPLGPHSCHPMSPQTRATVHLLPGWSRQCGPLFPGMWSQC